MLSNSTVVSTCFRVVRGDGDDGGEATATEDARSLVSDDRFVLCISTTEEVRFLTSSLPAFDRRRDALAASDDATADDAIASAGKCEYRL
jgi:hypothetical protein